MARSFSTPPTLPNPLGLASLEPILAEDLTNLGETVRHLIADGWPGPSQSWDGFSDNGASLTLRAQWRIPFVSSLHTSLKCMVYGLHNSGSGEKGQVEFRSVTAGDTCTLDLSPAASASWHDSVAGAGANQHLTIDASAGYETIQMYTRGDNTGTYATSVYDVEMEYVGASSPLAAGVVTGNAGTLGEDDQVVTDTEELDADSVLSSDVGYDLIHTLDSLEARPKLYFCWSEADGLTKGAGSYDGQQKRLYRTFTPRPLDSNFKDDYELTYHALIGNAGADVSIDVFASEQRRRPHGKTISVAAAAPAWVTGTMTAEEYRAFRDSQDPFTQMGFTGADSPEEIYSLSIWGR